MPYLLARNSYVALVIVLGWAMFYLMSQGIVAGRWAYAAVMALVASPVLMLGSWLLLQRGTPNNFSFKHMSFAAVLGDIFVLPTAMILLALIWGRLSVGEMWSFWSTNGWLALSMAVGMSYGAWSHWKGGPSDSRSTIEAIQLHDSATSWMHNLGVAPALFATLFYALVPLIMQWLQPQLTIAVILVLAAWLVMVWMDDFRSNLDPNHPWYFNPGWIDVVMNWPLWRPMGR